MDSNNKNNNNRGSKATTRFTLSGSKMTIRDEGSGSDVESDQIPSTSNSLSRDAASKESDYSGEEDDANDNVNIGSFDEEELEAEEGTKPTRKRRGGPIAEEPQPKYRRMGDTLIPLDSWSKLKRETDPPSREHNLKTTMKFFYNNAILQNRTFNLDPQSTRGTFAPILLYIHLLLHCFYHGEVLEEFTCSREEMGREILDIVECSASHKHISACTGMSVDTVNKALGTLESLKLIRRVKKVVSLLLPPPIPNIVTAEADEEQEKVPKEKLRELLAVAKLMKLEKWVIIKGLDANNK